MFKFCDIFLKYSVIKFPEEFKAEPITVDTLKREKTYKLGKKQLKELDTMRKKHLKERQTMQKNHCAAIDKLVKGKEYVVY